VAQVVEYLSKHETLSSNPQYCKKQNPTFTW
jgi:hypothetical protein